MKRVISMNIVTPFQNRHIQDTKRTQNPGNCSMLAQKCAICWADGAAYLLSSCTTKRTRSTLHSAGCNCLHFRQTECQCVM